MRILVILSLLFASLQIPTVFADLDREAGFPWTQELRLEWSDFRGIPDPSSGDSAAATHSSIGMRSQVIHGRNRLIIYNWFYINRSWVKADAKIDSILNHERGHFNLTEIFTRRMRARLSGVDLSDRQALHAIYQQTLQEYETQQQQYEEQTQHGTVFSAQAEWDRYIAQSLAATPIYPELAPPADWKKP